MKAFLYYIVELIAELHNKLLLLNDSYEYYFSDKELHFLVIGALGMGMVLAIYPVFKWLAKRNHILTLTWIYVFTVIIVITFAIEIGQKVTGTGVMEFADIAFGVVGFIAMFLTYAVIRAVCKGIIRFIRYIKMRNGKR